MAEPKHTISIFSRNVSGVAISVGDVVIPESGGTDYVVATSANRGTRGSEGIALTAIGSTRSAPFEMQTTGIIDPEISGLTDTGTKSLVRVSSTGRMERVSSYTAGDDIVGWAEADGRCHLFFGIPWSEIAGGGGGGSAAFTILNSDTGTINDIVSTDSGDDASGIRFSGAAPSVTGIASGADPRTLVLIATGGTLALKNENAGSAAANRIITGTGGDLTIFDEHGVTLRYDATASRWRVLRESPGYIGLGADPANLTTGVNVSYGYLNGLNANNSTDNDQVSLLCLRDGTSFGLGTDLVQIGNGAYNQWIVAGSGRVLNIWADDGKFNSGLGAEIASWNGYGFQFGDTTPDLGDGQGVIGIKEAAAVPTTNPTDGIVLYVEDNVLKYRQPDGTVIALNGSGSATFDPATLSLSVWNRGSFTTAPWAGTASAGGSGSVSLADSAVTNPAAGSAVNGFTPMADAGGDYLYGPANNTVWGAGGGSIIALVRPTSASANNSATINNPGIVAVNGEGQFQMGFSTSGLRVSVYDGAYNEAPAVAASTSAWHTFAARYTGSAVQASVDGSAFTSASTASSAPTRSSAAVLVGTNFSTSGMVGDIMEVICCDFAITQDELDSIIEYFKARYPAMGLP